MLMWSQTPTTANECLCCSDMVKHQLFDIWTVRVAMVPSLSVCFSVGQGIQVAGRVTHHSLTLFKSLLLNKQYYILKNKDSLLASVVPLRTFIIHRIFPFHKSFFIMENFLQTIESLFFFKKCRLKGSSGNQKLFFYGIAAIITFIIKGLLLCLF